MSPALLAFGATSEWEELREAVSHGYRDSDRAGAGLPPAEPQADARVYRCDCGQALRVSGVGRHRVYFEQGEGWLEQPVTNRACPTCERGLPGKNPQ